MADLALAGAMPDSSSGAIRHIKRLRAKSGNGLKKSPISANLSLFRKSDVLYSRTVFGIHMRVKATPMRARGVTRPQREVEQDTPVIGDLAVSQQKSETFNRYSNVASFHKAGASDAEPLPPLHDVALSWMGPNGFVLTVIEVVGGVTYAQSWWCRPDD